MHGNTSQSHPYIHIQIYASIQNNQEYKWKICYKGTTIILVLKNILPCKRWVIFRKTSIVPLNKITEFFIKIFSFKQKCKQIDEWQQFFELWFIKIVKITIELYYFSIPFSSFINSCEANNLLQSLGRISRSWPLFENIN